MGGYPVTVSEDKVPIPSAGYVGGENIILQQFNSTNLLVDEMKALVLGYMSDLSAMLASIEMPDGWADALADVTIAPVPAIDMSSVPTPSPPMDVSALWLAILTKIQTDLAGGSGLGAAVEAALYQRDADRKQAANEKAYAAGVSEIASKALSFPQYAMQNLSNQMAAEILRQEHASSNEIVISQAELAQKNTQFAVETGGTILTGLTKAEADIYESMVRAQTAWYNALTANNEAQLKVAELELRKVTEQLKATLEGTVSINSVREKITNGLLGATAQTMASALNAVNTSVGHTTSRSAGVQESWGHSESVSDIHQTEHDPEA